MKKALIVGVTGQDGSFLAELLLSKDYEVHGLVRRASSFNTARIDHLYIDPHENPNFFLHYGDLTDSSSIAHILAQVVPDEVYNLAAQSHVRTSFDLPVYTADVVAVGTVRLLEAIRALNLQCKIYQASSSEMFGNALAPQNEDTPFDPRSPYAAAKVYAYHICRNYREAYGMFISNGILYNHESERRLETFVTRKITKAAAWISRGLQKHLFLGNLSAIRDWGYAGDYVDAMWRMLQKDTASDYVIGTGKSHTVQEFVDLAFALVGLNWKEHVKFDARYLRPTEVDFLRADAKKAEVELEWRPTMEFGELVDHMVQHDCQLADIEKLRRS